MVGTRHALSWLFAGTALLGGAFGCAKDLNITEPVDASKVTVAQFDPTNPIPVLRLVPSPTGIAQDPATGNLDPASVSPQACELPTTKQCLQFAGTGGWPTTTPITLYFSNAVDEATIAQGIILLEANGTPVPFTPVISERPPINQACIDQFGIDASRIPPGIQVVLRPTTPIKPGTRYALLVRSGAMDGLRAADGSRVQPSSLFHLLNVADTGSDETRPVRLAPSDPNNPLSQINDPLLRSNVNDLVVAAVGMGTPFSEFSAEQRAAWAAGVSSSATRLFGLFQFFNMVITPLQTAGLIDNRNDIVFANAWSTAPAAGSSPAWEFNPQAGKVPFPNAQLLTVTSTSVRGGLRVANLPADNGNLDHIERTVNGFSTTSSVVMGVMAHVDAATIDPTPGTPCTPDDCKIVMYRLNDQDVVDDSAGVPLIVHVINGIDSKTMTNSSTVTIAPAVPLVPNTEYVVGVKRGIETPEGVLIGSGGQIFEFLKSPTPFVDAMGNASEEIDLFGMPFKFRQALECQAVPTTGMLTPAEVVKVTAGELENRLQHPRWEPAFSSLEGLSPAVPRSSLLMAFTYKTQDIHYDIDQIKETKLCSGAGCWDDATIIDTGFEVRGANNIAAAINVVGTLCVPVCELGGMAPAIPPDQCVTRDGAGNITGIHPDLAASAVCTLARSLITSRLGAMHKYVLVGHKIARGSPMNPNPTVGSWTQEYIDDPVPTQIPFWVVTGTGTPAAAGYPVVMFQHGLGSVKEAGFYMANTLASNRMVDPAGWAMVMMDLPFHGERASDLINNTTQQPCPAVDPNNIACTDPDGPGPQPVACTGVMGAETCDGRQDPSGTGFLGVNLFATRDNFRQATVDQLTLLRAIRAESAPGGALDHLDTTRIGYIGQSLGSITGANLAAYSTPEELTGMALNVGGGGLVNNVLLKTVPQIAAPLYFALSQIGICTLNVPGNPAAGCQDTPNFRRFRVVAQWILDPGDPLATSVGAVREIEMGRTPFGSENLHMQMSLPDPVVSNEASIDLARSLFASEGGEESDSFTTFDFSALPNATVGSGCHSFLLAPVCGRCLTDNICNSLGAQVEATSFVTFGRRLTTAERNAAVQQATGFDCNNPCAGM